MSVRAIGTEVMTWGEALRLTRTLLHDSSSQVGAIVAGWEYPATRELLALADIYDAAAHHTYKRPKPYPRPFPDETKKTFGKGTAIPLDRLRATLDAHRAAVEAERESAA